LAHPVVIAVTMFMMLSS